MVDRFYFSEQGVLVSGQCKFDMWRPAELDAHEMKHTAGMEALIFTTPHARLVSPEQQQGHIRQKTTNQ